MLMFTIGFHLFCWITFTGASPLFLTPYIKNNTASEGRRLSSVDQSQFLNVTSYSGYITVDEEYKSHLFFWFFPVANANVSETPLIIWLQGGPGGTSLLGTFLEIGPFGINESGTLQPRPSSWGVNHSLLFIDNPVETGLSFSETKHYSTNLDTCAEHLYKFLQQFLTVYPEVRAAPLFIAGESYGGRYVPAFAKKVYDNMERDGERKINLQGLIMGNPLFNYADTANISQIFYQWGLVDQQGLRSVKDLQERYFAALKNNASNAQELHDKLLDSLQDLSLHETLFNVLEYDPQLNLTAVTQYVNKKEFKEKVHGIEKEILYLNGDVANSLRKDFLLNMDSAMTFLLEHYRILIYCGQLDLVQPCVPNAEGRRRNWHWSKRSEFLNAHRIPIVMPPSEVAGYFKSGGGLTEVLISGAGHLVPIDKPREAQLIVTSFIKAEEPPSKPLQLDFNDIPNLDMDSPILNNSTQRPNNINNTSIKKPDTSSTTVSSTLGTNILKTVSSNPWNTVSWVFNCILIVGIIVCGVLYVKHKRRYRDYLLNDEDSLNNAMLTMS
ncbi:venom serine carboxypeptidase-like [Plodia interpunctella]|uniref:venom serine carboxypeptidase-like n=1 Tax=Plodia interpunctella TaxID=58824 RepID=UPI0023685998|nr:venom serine carboxypeptidase-like [Plodia interpunctella]